MAGILDGNDGYADVAQVERVAKNSVAARWLVVDSDWRIVSIEVLAKGLMRTYSFQPAHTACCSDPNSATSSTSCQS